MLRKKLEVNKKFHHQGQKRCLFQCENVKTDDRNKFKKKNPHSDKHIHSDPPTIPPSPRCPPTKTPLSSGFSNQIISLYISTPPPVNIHSFVNIENIFNVVFFHSEKILQSPSTTHTKYFINSRLLDKR